MIDRTVTVRMAKNDDGPDVEALIEKLGWFEWSNWKIDWNDLEPNWLVAEHAGRFVGCIQVCPARPIGRIEILCVDPELRLIMRYLVTRELTNHAVGVVKMYGAQAVCSTIPWRYGDYLHGAQNRGWEAIDNGSMIMKRLS